MKAMNWMIPALLGVALLVGCSKENEVKPKAAVYPDQIEKQEGADDLRSEYEDEGENERLEQEGVDLDKKKKR